MARDDPDLLELERIWSVAPAGLVRPAPVPRLAHLAPGGTASGDPSRRRRSRPPALYAGPRRTASAGSVAAAADGDDLVPSLVSPVAIRGRIGRVTVALEAFAAVIAVAARVAVAEAAAMARVAAGRRHLSGAPLPVPIHGRELRGALAALRITHPPAPSRMAATVAVVGANARGPLPARWPRVGRREAGPSGAALRSPGPTAPLLDEVAG